MDTTRTSLQAIPAHSIADGMKAGVSSWTLVDVRAPGDYKEAHVKNARNLPLDKVSRAASMFKATDPLALYSYDPTCPQARAAAKALKDQGFRAQPVVGGFEALKKEGCPITEQKKKD